VFELLKSLRKLQAEWKNEVRLIVYLKDKPLKDMPEETANFKYKVLSGNELWILRKLTPYLMFNPDKLNVFFSPSHYLPPLLPVPGVCSIMDLGYLEFSGQFTKKVFWQLKWWSAMSIFVSNKIIAISNSTKEDIVRHYPYAKGKVYVTHLAYDGNKFNTYIPANDVRRVKNRYSIVDDYVLYLGTLKPSKNIEGLVKAFEIVSKKFPKINLVITGKKGWLYEPIFKIVEKYNLANRVIFTDFIVEEDKPGLIAGAKVFVLPSFWEGFGLDILNAMASGVPVVASRVGSIPEVVGEAGILVNPNEPTTIADGILKILSMGKSDYNSMVSIGLAQAKKFSWEKTARETLDILKNIHRS
jgi:glycosyltransferase involved in cell wall biosynthesis